MVVEQADLETHADPHQDGDVGEQLLALGPRAGLLDDGRRRDLGPFAHEGLASLVAVELAQPSHERLGLPRRQTTLHHQLGRSPLVAARQRR
ncbi:MAG: hypothetical protein R3B72_42275 [Polyangiaceae bacterium]